MWCLREGAEPWRFREPVAQHFLGVFGPSSVVAHCEHPDRLPGISNAREYNGPFPPVPRHCGVPKAAQIIREDIVFGGVPAWTLAKRI